ncbi:MAG TPA: YqiA/YcfP family alpha/beta fold hydrolase [Bryobacteraceae bacterium]|nr:YqiA/YcfP family alpha/beta fold hydrolase [Bryobacteraceae bacterium]
MTRIVYLHGFASTPLSTKAQFFKRKFEGVDFEIPQLDQGDFQKLTITGQLGIIDQAVRGERVFLMGSSLGGYLAALYAARHANVERLVLMAPALEFPTRWRNRFSAAEMTEWRQSGARGFYHYGYKQDRPLGYAFVEDALQYEDAPDFAQPALMLHGSHDDVVPPEVSVRFAARHPNVMVKLLDSGHELTDVLEQLWSETAAFFGFKAGLQSGFQKLETR